MVGENAGIQKDLKILLIDESTNEGKQKHREEMDEGWILKLNNEKRYRSEQINRKGVD